MIKPGPSKLISRKKGEATNSQGQPMPCSKVQALGPASGPEPEPPQTRLDFVLVSDLGFGGAGLQRFWRRRLTKSALMQYLLSMLKKQGKAQQALHHYYKYQHFACMAPIFVGAAPILRSVKGSKFKSEILVPREVPVSMSCSTFFSTIFYSCHDVSMGGAHEVCSGA